MEQVKHQNAREHARYQRQAHRVRVQDDRSCRAIMRVGCQTLRGASQHLERTVAHECRSRACFAIHLCGEQQGAAPDLGKGIAAGGGQRRARKFAVSRGGRSPHDPVVGRPTDDRLVDCRLSIVGRSRFRLAQCAVNARAESADLPCVTEQVRRCQRFHDHLARLPMQNARPRCYQMPGSRR